MIKQLAILFGCLGVGELTVYFTGIQFPSSIIGMLLLTLLLKLRWIKLKWVKGISDLLTSNLAFFFIPAGVAIILYLDLLKTYFVAIVAASIVSAILTLIVTGHAYEILRKWYRKDSKSKAQ